MDETIPWFEPIQSVGRGLRSNSEIRIMGDAGKEYVVIDYESDDFGSFRRAFLTHYAEYTNHDTGQKYWKKFSRQPKASFMYRANSVVRKNEDGTYEYVKNRETGELRKLNEEEISWLLLKV